MIHRINYNYDTTIQEAGKPVQRQIPAPLVLQVLGPFIDVIITPGRLVCEGLQKAGKKIPSFTAKAIIDTGASSCIITPDIAAQLNLIQTGYKEIISVQDKQKQPEYFGTINFSWGASMEIPLVACQLSGFDCLIGREVMSNWYLTYDGKNGTIVICD